ncbi:helix-turn-helix domain-containing protein [Mucilaginibacter robiniae]|uniref:Helix-turn-helix domain-containing protein n=2 Tax=Mucilaginibacter robiniae TaxID=2728022 RepID=A0A7L5E7K0_9SPHI|nr:helix-turn-helix domain-containing protein [Mucilaginibacter robiniae]
MTIEMITKEDLEVFRQTLLNDIRTLISPSQTETKEWLRCADVRKILKVSTATVQNLRISGKLKSHKVNGIYFYNRADIERMIHETTG